MNQEQEINGPARYVSRKYYEICIYTYQCNSARISKHSFLVTLFPKFSKEKSARRKLFRGCQSKTAHPNPSKNCSFTKISDLL